MKLLLALTPAILIGCAFVETCAALVSKKQPAPASAAVVAPAARPSASAAIFALGTHASTSNPGTVSLAQIQMTP